MNAVIIAVGSLLALSLLRFHVVAALILSMFIGGFVAELPLLDTWNTFLVGLGGSSKLALSYALIGGFAYLVSASGITDFLVSKIVSKLRVNPERVKCGLIALVACFAIASQTVFPVHIAFIPLLIPPLLVVFNKINMDRRLVACLLSFGLVTPYMFLPFGFGQMFLNELILPQMESQGVNIQGLNIMKAMWLPALGMLIGLLIAMSFSYKQKRAYKQINISHEKQESPVSLDNKTIIFCGLAAVTFFTVQLLTDSMALGALAGYFIVGLRQINNWGQTNELFLTGTRMMASIGIIMMVAAGFAEVMKVSGHIDSLVATSVALFQDRVSSATFIMLAIGLIITLGIGSSFATVPLLAVIYVPVCMAIGLSVEMIACLLTTAAVLGDTGSPVSEVTLTTSASLNEDGQHEHMRDTVLPTFLHFNVPLLVFGWFAINYWL